MPKTRSKPRPVEETSAGTAQNRKKSGNKFSKMLSSSPPEQTQTPIVIENEQETSARKSVEETLGSQTGNVDMDRSNRGKSVESLASQINDEQNSSQRRSIESPSGDTMEFDHDDEYFDRESQRRIRSGSLQTKEYLTKREFDYTMNLLDSKIVAIYKLCRFIGDKQKEECKSLKRLVALDELSDNFWNVSYFTSFTVLF